MSRVLYGVSSVGLGHARRSLAIAKELRQIDSNIKLDWVCAEPARSFFEGNGENLLGVSKDMRSLSEVMESSAEKGKIVDMSRVARNSSAIAKQNYFLLKQELKNYDALIQDEFIETLFAFLYEKESNVPAKKAVVTDYVSFSTASLNPINRLVILMANRYAKRAWLNSQVRIFADELDSVSEKERDWVEKNFDIVGPIISGLPSDTKSQLKGEIFPNSKKQNLVVFSVGGTSVGRQLVDFVISNADELSNHLDAFLVVIAGPRIEFSQTLRESKNLKVVGFAPNALEYFKASDCVVTQAGASTLNEVAALGTPCVTIPIQNHFEQQSNAKRFHTKFGFPIIQYKDLNRETLVASIKKATETRFSPMHYSHAVQKAAWAIAKKL